MGSHVNDMLKITIDTSLVADETSTTLCYLVEAHQNNLLDVAVTSRFRMDKDNDSDLERVQRQKAITAKLNIIPSTFLIGAIHEDDEVGLLADDEIHQQLFCLFDIDRTTRGGKHTAYDVDHLYGHIISGRDIFLTYEKKFVKKRMVLKEVGINVAFPDKAVLAIQQALLEYPINTAAFQTRVMGLIEESHHESLNYTLLKRLQRLRQAQQDLTNKFFTQEDEKAIRYLAPRYKRYKGQKVEVCTFLFKQHYHNMKGRVLWHFPNRTITTGSIIGGVLALYGRYFDND